jgi:hypothetical protein
MTFLRPLLPIAIYVSLAAAGIFQLSIFDIESPLNGQIVNAAGEAFYAGLSGPASYRPQQGASDCPVGNTTLLAGMDALWVYLPLTS